MSGGVDSSVAAWLLKEQGHDVIGMFMRHGNEPVDECRSSGPSLPILPGNLAQQQGCCTASDALDARRVADALAIPFYAVNFDREFTRIMEYFVDEYTRGRTPNPCVMCNNWLKFGSLLNFARGMDAAFIATGHYARLEEQDSPNNFRLLRGVDPDKDQSYVLFGISRNVLSRILFPVGELYKSRIREIARQLGFRVADKKDSQEICFTQKGKHAEFVKRLAPDEDRTGEIVSMQGEILGRHNGLEEFTVGQRKGLRVAVGERQYVVKIDKSTRRVYIGDREDLNTTTFNADQCNWLVDVPAEFSCEVMIRYRSALSPARVVQLPGDRIQVTLKDPRQGVAPGQAVVCYDGDQVLGGGWIE